MTLGRVGVIGLGLIGGSLARALVASGQSTGVRGYDLDPRARATARNWGLDGVDDEPAETVAGAEIVVLAVPINVMPACARAVAGQVAEGALVTDTGSVKAGLVPLLEDIFGPGFVGGHPLAGSERSGAAAADAGLFRGSTYVLTPTAGTRRSALERAEALVTALGARPLLMDADRHDRLLALTSHLPYLVASALAAATASVPAAAQVVASGWRDTTRVAAGRPSLYAPVVESNRIQVLEALDAFSTQLQVLRRAVETGGPDLVAGLEPGSAFRSAVGRARGWE